MWSRQRLRQALSLKSRGRDLGNQDLGELGERIAAHALVAAGRKILWRNYRGPKGGEVDLVTRDGKVLAFVEVKTRRRGGRGRPLDAVDAKKRKLMRRGGNAWLKLLSRSDITWRHDVVEVVVAHGELAQITVLQNVDTDASRNPLEVREEGEIRVDKGFFA